MLSAARAGLGAKMGKRCLLPAVPSILAGEEDLEVQGAQPPTSAWLCSGAGPAATDVPTRGLLSPSLGPTGLLWSHCSYLKPDEDKKSKHKTAVKKKTLNPEFNEVGVGWVWFSPRGFSQPQT